MAVRRLAGFAGEVRALHPKLVADTVGTVSRNQKPGRGDLRPWRQPLAVATVPAGRKTIYRMGRDVASDANYWLSWPTYVHAALGFDAEDTTERTYYTGDGTPKVTDNIMALAATPYPTASRPLGIPAPATPCVVTAAGVTPPADVGKHEHLIADYTIQTLVVGDILRIKVKGLADQSVTLTEPALGAGVTAAHLATQLAALNGITASSVPATDTTPAGVKVVSDAVGIDFTIERKTGTTSVTTTDTANPVYTLLYEDYGTASEQATVTIPHSDIIAMDVPTKLAVKINAEPEVLVTVNAGSGTYPPKVTANSLRSALANLVGVTVALVTNADGVSQDAKLTTTAVDADAYIRLRKVTYNNTTTNTDSYATMGASTEISEPSPSINSYFYTYTFVNDWGWESAPAPVSNKVDRATDASATITSFAAVPAGNYQVNRIRVYRTQTGSSGTTEFFFLREVAYGTASTTDDSRDLGEVLETTNWLAAPADLHHLTPLWNGMLAGISGNGVRLCEANVPYAWPIAYDHVPPDAKPVAIGTFGQTVVALTTGRPMLLAGSGPDSMDQAPLEFQQACVAPESVVSMGRGVAWASSDGLCWFGADGARILTAGILTREDWQAMVPSSVTGRHYEGLYFGSYDDGAGRKGFLIDPMNPTGIYFLDTGYEAMHFDKLRDQLYVLDGTSVKKWDAGAAMMTARFKSKQYRDPAPLNYAAAEVVADSYPVTLRVDALELPAAAVTAMAAARPAIFSAPDATTLRYTASVPSKEPVPLPAGFEANTWQVEIETTGAVQGVALATSMEELAQV